MDIFNAIGRAMDEFGLPSSAKNPNVDQSTDFWGFMKSIDWSEPWLIGLVTCHVCLFFVILLLRNHIGWQSIIGIGMLAFVYTSESINKLLAENWRYFAREQYFDSHGMFISTVFCGPMLFNCMIIVCNFLLHNFYVLKELQQLKIRQIKKKNANSDRKNITAGRKDAAERNSKTKVKES